MNMAMDEIARLEIIHKCQKRSKPAMWQVWPIVNAQRRRMGQHNIYIAPVAQIVNQQARCQRPYAPKHLRLGVLRAQLLIVSNAAAETGDQQPILANTAPFDRNTSAWR